MTGIKRESRIRARALQLLYAWELRGCPPFHTMVGAVPEGASRRTHVDEATRIASQVAANHMELDREIEEVIEGWKYTRVGTVERNILRLALHELVTAPTPPRVVLDEAVRLAQWFAGSKAPAFVNGVLDTLARRHQRL